MQLRQQFSRFLGRCRARRIIVDQPIRNAHSLARIVAEAELSKCLASYFPMVSCVKPVGGALGFGKQSDESN